MWVRRDGDVATPHRRRIAASLVLELIDAADVAERPGFTSLLAWASDLVTTDAPSEAERLWHHAAIGLAQGMRNWSVLSISRARERFPEDRRLAFAELQVIALQSVASWRGWAGTVDLAATNYRVNRFLERATSFFADPQIGGEAHLWSGLLLLLNRQDGAKAMAQFAAARNDPDPFVADLARYSAGRVQEAAGHPGPSEAAYRDALAVWPRAQSASLSLASLLFASGRPDEAYQLVADAYREPTVMDPFREYGFGQHRRVDRVMTELRQELRR
jgi:tetratricopeptide (TPR) repeat protein